MVMSLFAVRPTVTSSANAFFTDFSTKKNIARPAAGRFGFSPARARGLEAPFPVPDEAFLALELVPGALDGIAGMVRYPAPFEEV